MITRTKAIDDLLEDFCQEDQEDILKQAWGLCCDPEWLGENLSDPSIDPWDGKHEYLRKILENHAVLEIEKLL